ncbi:MAG: CPBP family intramembrane metalloprotease, partial [Chlorobi bacterium]|nr:CPBP family intramembrane metalloprotease [Chlorobiota bacterium]
FALGEEILWRGLIPTLLGLRYKFFYATFLSWLFWFLWHLPLTALLQYKYPHDAPLPLVILASALVTLGMTLTMMPLRYATNSIIPTALLHGMTMSMGLVADYFISDTLWTGASGIITGIVWTLAGLVSYLLFVGKSKKQQIR